MDKHIEIIKGMVLGLVVFALLPFVLFTLITIWG